MRAALSTAPPAPEAKPLSGRPRLYPEVRVGDVFGDRTVVMTFPRGHRGRRDEVVRWRCVCGVSGESFAHNLRVSLNDCRHRPVPRAVQEATTPLARVKAMASGRCARLSPLDREALRAVLAELERLGAST